jgi:hypothetical protein
MSINQDRHFTGGTAALAAARRSTKQRTITAQPAHARPTGAAWPPANALELYPGSDVRRTGVRRRLGSEAGMATAEYAIATLAAVGFAGLLVFILRSEEVRGFLLNLIRTALALP